MPDWFNALTDGFMPHGYCLRWNGPLLFVFIAGNLGISIAYFLIPAALKIFIGRRKDLPYPYVFKLFAVFILSCGITHLAKIWTLYQPVYWLEATVDLWTAFISLLTAAVLFPLIPQALRLRSPRELQEANDRLRTQVQETVKAQAAAEAARDEAIKANKLKSEFVATISHEIRTPMSSIIGMSELLTCDPDPADVPELSERIYNSSKRLLDVLNSMLDFSKLEAGKMASENVSFSIADIMQEVIGIIAPGNQTKQGVRLEFSTDPQLPASVTGDQTKIRQVLINFLHNAIKFTDAGQIKMQAQLMEKNEQAVIIRFSISDTGIGISPENQRKLFNAFVQADASTTRRFGGTGLGLAIAKQYVELMHGHLGLESAEGEGSTFWFEVPLQTRQDD